MTIYIEAEAYPNSKDGIIEEAKKKGFKYCIVAASKYGKKRYKAVFLVQSSSIFKVIRRLEKSRYYYAHEVRNLDYDITIPLIYNLKPTQYRRCIRDRNEGYENIHYRQATSYLTNVKISNTQVSQYDIQRWFDFGHYTDFCYMLIVKNDIAYNETYPVYSHHSDLSATIMANQIVCRCSIVEIYDLSMDFIYQYKHRLFSLLSIPRAIYTEREEVIPVFSHVQKLDGLRRRLWDYLRFCQVDLEPGLRSIGAAIELMKYAQEMGIGKSEFIKTMILKAVPILYPVNLEKTWGKRYYSHMEENWKLVPLYLILSYYGLTYYDNEINKTCLSPFPGIRNFSLYCRTIFKTPELLERAYGNIYYYCGAGFSTNPLLYSLWLMCDKDDSKLIKFVEDQPWSEKKPGTVSAAVNHFLQSDRTTDVFSDFADIHCKYRERYYVNDKEYHLAMYLNPSPRLDLPGEFITCKRKAEKGDLESILTLAAHYWRDEDWQRGAEKKAYKWIMKGLAFDHPTALYLLGLAYYCSDVLTNDHNKAFEIFKQCAEMGYATAYIDLGFCYKNGQGTPEDKKMCQACLIVAERYLMETDSYGVFDEYLDTLYNEDYWAAKEEIDMVAEELCKKIKTIDLEPINYMPLYGQKAFSDRFVRFLIRSERYC